jgi:hypothetical protein
VGARMACRGGGGGVCGGGGPGGGGGGSQGRGHERDTHLGSCSYQGGHWHEAPCKAHVVAYCYCCLPTCLMVLSGALQRYLTASALSEAKFE